MLNRLFFALTLILSFGMAQIGAVTHEISHYSDIYAQAQADQSQNIQTGKSGFKSSKPSEPISHNQVCEKCMGYAELGHIAHGAQNTLLAIQPAQVFHTATVLNSCYTKPRTYSARAPPYFV